jgi:hypothetical protein
MAGLDASIILGGKQPDVQSPLDSYSKALAIKGLINRNQIESNQAATSQQDFEDNQAIRHAMNESTSVSPDGSTSVDPNKMTSILGQGGNPYLAVRANAALQQQQLQIQNARMEQTKSKLSLAAQIYGGVKSQKEFEAANDTARNSGMSDVADKMGDTYDPNIISSAINKGMDVTKQIEMQQKAQGLQIDQQKADIEQKQLQLALKKDQSGQNQETLSALQALRGNPALQRAETNVLASKNLNDLAEQARDPRTGKVDLNRLNPQQVSLFDHELVRMATGGTGNESDMENLKPGTPQYKLAQFHQKITGKSTGTNAGEYLQQGLDYANTLASSSNQFLYSNAKHVVDAKRNYLAPQDAQKYDSWLNDMKAGKSFFSDGTGGGSGSGSGKAGGLQMGQIVGTHKYLGGDPNKQSSWASVTAGK